MSQIDKFINKSASCVIEMLDRSKPKEKKVLGFVNKVLENHKDTWSLLVTTITEPTSVNIGQLCSKLDAIFTLCRDGESKRAFAAYSSQGCQIASRDDFNAAAELLKEKIKNLPEVNETDRQIRKALYHGKRKMHGFYEVAGMSDGTNVAPIVNLLIAPETSADATRSIINLVKNDLGGTTIFSGPKLFLGDGRGMNLCALSTFLCLIPRYSISYRHGDDIGQEVYELANQLKSDVLPAGEKLIKWETEQKEKLWGSQQISDDRERNVIQGRLFSEEGPLCMYKAATKSLKEYFPGDKPEDSRYASVEKEAASKRFYSFMGTQALPYEDCMAAYSESAGHNIFIEPKADDDRIRVKSSFIGLAKSNQSLQEKILAHADHLKNPVDRLNSSLFSLVGDTDRFLAETAQRLETGKDHSPIYTLNAIADLCENHQEVRNNESLTNAARGEFGKLVETDIVFDYVKQQAFLSILNDPRLSHLNLVTVLEDFLIGIVIDSHDSVKLEFIGDKVGVNNEDFAIRFANRLTDGLNGSFDISCLGRVLFARDRLDVKPGSAFSQAVIGNLNKRIENTDGNIHSINSIVCGMRVVDSLGIDISLQKADLKSKVVANTLSDFDQAIASLNLDKVDLLNIKYLDMTPGATEGRSSIELIYPDFETNERVQGLLIEGIKTALRAYTAEPPKRSEVATAAEYLQLFQQHINLDTQSKTLDRLLPIITGIQGLTAAKFFSSESQERANFGEIISINSNSGSPDTLARLRPYLEGAAEPKPYNDSDLNSFLCQVRDMFIVTPGEAGCWEGLDKLIGSFGNETATVLGFLNRNNISITPESADTFSQFWNEIRSPGDIELIRHRDRATDSQIIKEYKVYS